MRKYFSLLVFFITVTAYSQDIIVLKDGTRISCKIVKRDSAGVFYNFVQGGEVIPAFRQAGDIQECRFNGDSVSKRKSGAAGIQDTSGNVRKLYVIWTGARKYGVNTTGWSIQWYVYKADNFQKWIVPFFLEIDKLEIRQHYLEGSDYQWVEAKYLTMGVSPFRKLSDSFHFNVGLHTVMGWETSSKTTENNIIIGLGSTQGIYYIAKSHAGLTFGIALYEKVLTSEYLRNDFGIKLEFGVII